MNEGTTINPNLSRGELLAEAERLEARAEALDQMAAGNREQAAELRAEVERRRDA